MLVAQHFDLASLRGSFTEQFTLWDDAVRERDSRKAKRARRAIQKIARAGLAGHPAMLGGFYLFLDTAMTRGLSGLNYVGIADTTRRPIARRIEDRLKDDSSLDVALDHLEVADAKRIVTARLLCALPESGHNYVDKHLAVAELFRRSPSVILIGCPESKQLIRETEKILIGSAAANGAPLTNAQHLRFRGSVSRPAFDLANATITEAGMHGLPNSSVTGWRGAVESVAAPHA